MPRSKHGPWPPPTFLLSYSGCPLRRQLGEEEGASTRGSRAEMQPLSASDGLGKGRTFGNYYNMRKFRIKPPPLPMCRGCGETIATTSRRKIGNFSQSKMHVPCDVAMPPPVGIPSSTSDTGQGSPCITVLIARGWDQLIPIRRWSVNDAVSIRWRVRQLWKKGQL